MTRALPVLACVAVTHRVVAALAARVRDLRLSTGLSQVELGERMTEMGVEWSRTTVAKLESGRRESVSVEELYALAQVFDVPLVWLLADPQSGRPVAISEGVEVDPWTALLWLTGFQPLGGRGGSAWSSAYNALSQLNILARVLEQYRLIRRMLDVPMVPAQPAGEGAVADADVLTTLGDPAEARRQLEATEVTLLRSVADRLGQFRALNLPVPPVPPDVVKRATELGINLPGQEE